MGFEKLTLEVLRAFSRARRAWSCFNDVLLKAMVTVVWTSGCAAFKNSDHETKITNDFKNE